jgi:formylglycine-generating enzyme required for sulfatase activity
VLLALLLSWTLPAGRPEFVKIPAGTFVMGCEPSQPCVDAQPQQKIEFDGPFWIHRTEVTVRDFRRFVEATGYRTEAEKAGLPWTWSKPRAFKLVDEQPVVYVTFDDAEAYCSWAGARLPTEPEWSYAFRAGEATNGHLWWNTDGRYVWYRENSDARPHPVGRKLPNRWGLHDMEGNAWEWTRAVRQGHSPAAIRGGSWITCPVIEGAPKRADETMEKLHQPFSRCPSDGKHIRDDVGFRCARSEP